MSLSSDAGKAGRAITVVPLASLVWLAVTAVFLTLRAAVIWEVPVGGSEWVHLSGAWNASIGVDDERFVPTLFQAFTAVLLELDSSEALPRTLAFLATASLPLAVYLLREQIGTVAGLLALLLLAIDAPSLWLGVAATSSGFDVALTAWLLVFLVRPGLPWWPWPVLGFAVVTAGPVPLVLAFAAAFMAILRGSPLPPVPALVTASAALIGVLVASLGFGYGWQGILVPPIELFAQTYEADWTTGSALHVAWLYSWPLLIAGAVAAVLELRRWREPPLEPDSVFTVRRLATAWFLAGLLSFLVGMSTNAAVTLAAATLPAAFIVAPWLGRAIDATFATRDGYAWLGLGIVLFLAALAMIVIVDWARFDRVGPGGEVARVVILGAATAAGLAALAYLPRSRAVLTVPAVFVAALVLVSGAFHVAFGSRMEPFPSPQSPVQAETLADLALEQLEATEDTLVVHESLRDRVTWPFRETTTLVIATTIPQDAGVAIVPAGESPPDGMVPLEGDWSLEHHIEQPAFELIRYVRWFTDRNRTDVDRVPVEVFVRGDE